MNTITGTISLHNIVGEEFSSWAETGRNPPYNEQNIVCLPQDARLDDILQESQRLSVQGIRRNIRNFPESVLGDLYITWQEKEGNPAYLQATIGRTESMKTEAHLGFIIGAFIRRVNDLVPTEIQTGIIRLGVYDISIEGKEIQDVFMNTLYFAYARGEKDTEFPPFALVQSEFR